MLKQKAMEKLILLLVLVFMAGSSAAQTVITTPAELQAMEAGGDYILGNDIDMDGLIWEALSWRESGVNVNAFTGTFDGDFHVIKNFTGIDDELGVDPFKTASLFGIVDEGGVVKNVGMTNVNVYAGNYVAALVGDLYGTVSNCYVESGTVTMGGGNNGGTVIGLTRGPAVVRDCYSTADMVMTGPFTAAGFVQGVNCTIPIENCYFAGTITSEDGITAMGGFARVINTTVTSCYFDKDVAGPDATLEADLGRTTAEMMTQATFVDWDFGNTWFMSEGQTYPVLSPLVGAFGPDPSNDETVLPNANLVLSWGLLPGLDSDDVYVDVWFGTEPNETDPAYDMSRIVVKGLNTITYDSVDVSEEDTYYWRINSWINDIIDDANMITGGLWRFHTAADPPPTVVIETADQMTWSGEGVELIATVTNDGPSATVIEWFADPAYGVDIAGNLTDNPTVTITNLPYSEAKIINAGFEDPVLVDGGYFAPIVGWGWFETDYRETTNPYAVGGDLVGEGAYPAFYGIAPEGQNIAQTGGGGIVQVLNETLAADTIYTLTVEVGRPAFLHTWDDFRVQLLAGGTPRDTGEITEGTLLAEDPNTVIVEDTFELVTVTFDSTGVAPALLGEPLQIRLLSGPEGDTIYFDDVRLTAVPDFPATSWMQTVTMTVQVSDASNPIPVADSVEIDVYSDACAMARLGEDKDDPNDLNKDCDIDVIDLSLQVATWLNVIELDVPTASIYQPEPGMVTNGDFKMYKPGTGYTVRAFFPDDTYYIVGMGDNVLVQAGKLVDYADGTTGQYVDAPGWVTPLTLPLWRDGEDFTTSETQLYSLGVDVEDGTSTLNCFGEWSGQSGNLAESAEPLGYVNIGTVYTLSAMCDGDAAPLTFELRADGVAMIPSSSVTPVGDPEGWVEISRTYNAEDITAYIGEPITIVAGTTPPPVWDPINPDPNVPGYLTGTRMKYDNITLDMEVLNADLPTVDAGDNMVTWSGKPVQLDPTVVNNDPNEGTLTYLWTADPDDGVTFDSSADVLAPTVTITNPASVRLTLAVTLESEYPVSNYMTIDVYDNTCLAALAVDPELDYDIGDLNEDCITNLKDFAEVAAAWLEDYSSTGQADRPEEE